MLDVIMAIFFKGETKAVEYNGIINLIMFGKIFGIKNLILFHGKKWSSYKLPFNLPVFGTISRREELTNIRDNILQGSIRDRVAERQIRQSKHPVVIDCGVNIGVTVRWWLYLNKQATIYGIDMMQEANDFTMNSVPDDLKSGYVPITAILFSETGVNLKIHYDDPLFGGNSIEESDKYSENRCVYTSTLDDSMRGRSIETVDLLKVDVENYAAPLLRGAGQILSKTKNILLEVHGEKEREDSVALLREKGFEVRRSYRRHLWFDRAL